jgi:hypothetical protein
MSFAAVTVLALAVPAVAATPTLKIDRPWLLKTSTGNKSLAAGGTYKHCSAQHIQEIDARGHVSGATKGASYKAVWRKDGVKIITFTEHWSKTSGKVTVATLSNQSDNLPDGKYKVTARQNGKALASSSISLKTKSGC